MTQKNTKMKSREKLRLILKEEGPQPAKILAQMLNISTMAISQHLNDMLEQGDLKFYSEKHESMKGRPIKIWSLTEQAHNDFPDSHNKFTVELISSIRNVFGDDGMEKLLDVRATDQISQYTKLMAGQTLEEKLETLTKIRTAEGYMSVVEKDEDAGSFTFIENHCPVCDAAKSCSSICERELYVFRKILGPDVQTERHEHILKGARRCAYKVTAL